jgi:hypothetical protein
MRLEQDQSSHPRLLRKPALGEVSATTHIKAEKKVEQPRGSRFVGATHMDDGQKARICMALKDKSVGDEIGRQIFIGAVEYQISAFAHRLEHRPEPEPEHRTGRPNASLEKTLQAIVETARALSALLRELPDSAKTGLTKALAAQDELGRGYDERYLCGLGCEIDRLEHACTAAVDASGPKEPEADPDSSRAFVAKLAEIFVECFEMQATAQEDGSFRASLIVLGEVTGLVIGHEPEFLAQVLAAES